MGLEHFEAIYQRVCERKGSKAMVESLLAKPLSRQALLATIAF